MLFKAYHVREASGSYAGFYVWDALYATSRRVVKMGQARTYSQTRILPLISESNMLSLLRKTWLRAMGNSSQDSRTGALLLLVSGKLWFVVVCIQLLMMVESIQAWRTLPHYALKQRRLLACTDNNNIDPRHASSVKSFWCPMAVG